MENKDRPDLGPKPTRPPTVTALSRARRGVLELLYEQTGPTTLNVLVKLSGLHENTLRGHLEGLESVGLVTRERGDASGRGRPPWLWRVSPTEVDEYAGLAATLARTLRRSSPRPVEDAVEAGRDWGATLAAARAPRASRASRSPTAQVRDLLDRLGFGPVGKIDPVTDTVDLRLTSCPLLEAAQEEPEIVCNVHLGLAIGALNHYGAADPDAHLQPFAEPGACRLALSSGSR